MLTVTLSGTTAEGADWVSRGGFGMILAGTHVVAIGGSSINSQHLCTAETLDIADLAGVLEKKRNRYYLVLVSHETGFPCRLVNCKDKASHPGR